MLGRDWKCHNYREKGWENGQTRECPVLEGVCMHINELTFVHVNHQSIVSEKIGSQDRFLNICNDKNPW